LHRARTRFHSVPCHAKHTLTTHAFHPARVQAEKAPSLPAIKRSSSQQTNWRVLTQKGQSFSLGDTICMQITPAGACGCARAAPR
jgi:hypothetical protein